MILGILRTMSSQNLGQFHSPVPGDVFHTHVFWAEFLRLEPESMKKLIKKEGIRHKKLGSNLLIWASDIYNYEEKET